MGFAFNKGKKEVSYEKNLIIEDLDEFFTNVYDYYYHKGYYNILTQTILDNMSFLFTINFFFITIFILDWRLIYKNCLLLKQCEINLQEIFNFSYFFSSKHLIMFYFLFLFYYIWFFMKSLRTVVKMRKIREIFKQKLKMKQNELENINFIEVIDKLIDLQNKENFCRVKDNLTRFDIIARILRKENYITSLISNDKVNFIIHIPFIGKKNLLTNYTYENLKECIMDYAFTQGSVNISKKFVNYRQLQFRIFYYCSFEIIIMIPLGILKLILWLFTNADNIKSNRNLNKRTWSTYAQIMFKNYNELKHIFENRISHSYFYSEKFILCFKEKFFSIIARFLSLVCGSFLFILFIISTINEDILMEISIGGKKLVWYACIIGILISFSSNFEETGNIPIQEEFYDIVQVKQKYYQCLVNKLINIPENWRIVQNLSKRFKLINLEYNFIWMNLFNELLSIIFFPYLWMKLFFQASDIVSFLKNHTVCVEGLGDICGFSINDLKKYKAIKEKEYGLVYFNERKSLNSYILFQVILIKTRKFTTIFR